MPANHQPPSEERVPILLTNLQMMIFEKTPLIGNLPGQFLEIIPQLGIPSNPQLGITSTIWTAMCLAADLRKLDKEKLLGYMKKGSGQNSFVKALARYHICQHTPARMARSIGSRDIPLFARKLSPQYYGERYQAYEGTLMSQCSKNLVFLMDLHTQNLS